jgi:hypothetical protein
MQITFRNGYKEMKVTINFKSLIARGFGGYLKGSVKKKGVAQIIIDIDALLNCCSDPKNKDLAFKEIFCETVTHEIFHAIEELFDKSFNHKRINKALSQIIKDK